MKLSVLFISLIFVLSFLGCTDTNISNPKSLEKNYSLLELPLSADDLSVEGAITISKQFDGSIGGTLTGADSYNTKDGMVNLDVNLEIPAGLFTGIQTVSVTLDGQYAMFKFAPDLDAQQVIPVLFSCTFTGINLRAGQKYDFCHIAANGNVTPCTYNSIEVDLRNGTLKVRGAQIIYEPDSRYGWATSPM